MSKEKCCEFCGTPFNDERDKDGLPFCTCIEAQNEQLHILLRDAMKLIEQYYSELAEAKQYNHLYADAMHRGARMYANKHPTSSIVWPDAADNITWLMEELEELLLERQKVTTALGVFHDELDDGLARIPAMETKLRELLTLPHFISRKASGDPEIPGYYLCYYDSTDSMAILKLDNLTAKNWAFTHWMRITDPLAARLVEVMKDECEFDIRNTE